MFRTEIQAARGKAVKDIVTGGMLRLTANQ
jgi:hypothetical protein